jgi:hypothetical protein
MVATRKRSTIFRDIKTTQNLKQPAIFYQKKRAYLSKYLNFGTFDFIRPLVNSI